MPLLNKEYIHFDKQDVELMQGMLGRFDELHGGAETPDSAANYVAYLPVFAIALLLSQQEAAKNAKRLERLTYVLVALTIALVALTVVLAFPRG